MSRRKRAGLSPNLFPFLAVLVCTLGTLILLLALVAQKAEESAEQMVTEHTESAKLVAEEERWEAEVLIEHRRKQTDELDKRRSELAHIEDHARRLREELEVLKQEIEATEREEDQQQLSEAATRLVSLRKRSEEEKEQIARLAEERDGKPPRVIIVPYRGTNGTERRPIYVECTSTAVIIQPEGVKITAGQLDGPLGPGNPLDAALRAVRAHWQTLDPNAPPPYPLLLVRPSGIHAYAASRIAMSTWDDQFGYELIPENLELAFPVKDPGLEIKLVEAIQVAVARNRARIAGAPSKYSGFTPQRVASNGGSGNSSTGSRSSGNGGTGAGVTSDGQTMRSGVSDNPYAYENESGPRGFTVDGADLMVKNGTGSGGGGAGAAGSGFESTGDVRGGLSTSGSPNTGAMDGNNQMQASPTLSGPLVAGANESSVSGANVSTQSTAGGSNTEYYSEDQFLGSDMSAGGNNGTPGTGTAGGSPTDSGFAGNNPDSQLDGQAAGQLASGQMTGGGAGSGSTSSEQATTAGMSAAAMADPNQQASMFNSSAAPDPHEKTFSETMENRYSSSSNRGSSNSSSNTPPILAAGNNWALPESMLNRRGTSIVREMKLRCTTDGYVLMPEIADQQPQSFPIQNGLVEKSVMDLAKSIRDRVDRWGVAMQNGRWEPVLSVQVSEGADTRFRQLQTLLKNSGVRVEREDIR